MSSNRYCQEHSDRIALWVCDRCSAEWCQPCMDAGTDPFDPIATRCPSCRGRCRELDDPKGAAIAPSHRPYVTDLSRGGAANAVRQQATQAMAKQSWGESLLQAFAYPVQGENWWFLWVAVLFFVVVDFITARALVLALLLAVFFAGYFCSYLVSIVRHSAHGDFDLPYWPDFSTDGILRPLFMFVIPFLFSVGPGIIVSFWLHRPVLGRILVFVGLTLLPMMLLAAIVLNHPLAANPLLAIPAMVRTPLPYLSVVAMFALAVVSFDLTGWVVEWLGVLGNLIIRYAAMYFSVLCMHVLGLFYFRYSQQLRWLPDIPSR